MIFNESYVYKKPRTMLAIENSIALLKRKYDGLYQKEKLFKMYTKNKQFHNKVIADVGKMLKVLYANLLKEFNFGVKSKIAIDMTPEINMYTYNFFINPKKYSVDKFDTLITVLPDKRIRFANNKILNANITILGGLLFHQAITAEMIVAAILHEVGHIFSFPFFKLTYSLDALDNFTKIDCIADSKQRYLELSKFKRDLIDTYGNYGLYNLLLSGYTTEREKFADYFSSYYGYSEELSKLLSAFFTLTDSEKAPDTYNPLSKLLWDLDQVLYDSNGEYPVTFNRINYSMNALRNEIDHNPNISREDKAKLNAKIDRINNRLAKMYSMDNASSLYSAIRNFYYIHKIGGNQDQDNKYNKVFNQYTDYYSSHKR